MYPLILWLLGVPVVVIILLMLLRFIRGIGDWL
jgi:Na+-transporting methylmalonyl-CoA/oxaloacetate decarboxylase gamma subunit